jgi:hypothetical protein
MPERDAPSTQIPRHDLPGPDDARAAEVRPENVMGGHHAITGSARGIGSIAYDDPGAFDVGAGQAADDPGTGDRSESRSFAAHDAPSGPLETGGEFRTEAELADRDPGDGTDRLSPENARPEGRDAEAAARWARDRLDAAEPGGNEQSDARRMHGEAASSTDADDAPHLQDLRAAKRYGSLNGSDAL